MRIEIRIDENCNDPEIIVVTDKMTDEINNIIKKAFGRTILNDSGVQK